MTTTTLAQAAPSVNRTRTELLISLAARTVPPLWPLDGAIAVNPLSGLEERPFEDALREGARLFGARSNLPLSLWRRISTRDGLAIDEVRRVAVERLGGPRACFELTDSSGIPRRAAI